MKNFFFTSPFNKFQNYVSRTVLQTRTEMDSNLKQMEVSVKRDRVDIFQSNISLSINTVFTLL